MHSEELKATLTHDPLGEFSYLNSMTPSVTPRQWDPILTPEGTLNWGQITGEMEKESGGIVLAAPIRLFHGRHSGPNRGFGKIHIVAEHSKEFVAEGFDRFVSEAVTRFESIHLQDNKRIAVFRSGRSRLFAALEYRLFQGQSYYSIVTVFRTGPFKVIRGDIAWQKR